MTTYRDCAFPHCNRGAAPEMEYPVCGHHARKIYLEVKQMVADADWYQQSQAAVGSGRARRGLRDEMGLVYFARIGSLVKIGFTTDLKQRMSAIRANEVLATTPGTRRDEKAMHVRFGTHWLGGEMFRAHPDLLAYAAELGHAA